MLAATCPAGSAESQSCSVAKSMGWLSALCSDVFILHTIDVTAVMSVIPSNSQRGRRHMLPISQKWVQNHLQVLAFFSFFFFFCPLGRTNICLFKEIKWNQKISTFDLLKLEKTKQRDFLLKIWSTLDYQTISLFEHHQLNVWPPSLCTIENGIGFFQNQCFFFPLLDTRMCVCVFIPDQSAEHVQEC